MVNINNYKPREYMPQPVLTPEQLLAWRAYIRDQLTIAENDARDYRAGGHLLLATWIDRRARCWRDLLETWDQLLQRCDRSPAAFDAMAEKLAAASIGLT